MNANALARFVALAAIWGASFLFMRILAPEVGALWTAQSRLMIGALVLWVYLLLRKTPLNAQHWRHYAVAGFLNCALPFTLFAVAGKLIPASYSAVLNSSVPLWATVFGALFMNDSITPQKMLALALGIVGVGFVASPSADVAWSAALLGGIVACLLASACYALNAIYLKKYAQGIAPQPLAALSQAVGALLLLPMAMVGGLPSSISPAALLSGLILGVMCSGVAFLLYYRLLEEIGPVMVGSVTFLIPLFGIFWGRVILSESIGWNVLAGCGLIISGAFLLYRSNLPAKKVAA
ncbi:MAG: DMT family transporter [Formosimonas sp.]